MTNQNREYRRRPGGRRPERRLSVRSVRRDPPDLRKLSRVLIALAQADAEKQAALEHDRKQGEKLEV